VRHNRYIELRALAGTACTATASAEEKKKAREPSIARVTGMLLAAAGRLALQMARQGDRDEVIMAPQRAHSMCCGAACGPDR
jgi:hypothetical protein